MSKWISVKDRLPEPETEVIVLASRNTYQIITTAMYEDGKTGTEDSVWNWQDVEFKYDEENDLYIIPEGWWEHRHYNPDDVYNNCIDDVITHWQPLPEPPKDEPTIPIESTCQNCACGRWGYFNPQLFFCGKCGTMNEVEPNGCCEHYQIQIKEK